MNKPILLIILNMLVIISVSSETIVNPGDVSGIWNYEGSPYLIQGDITIPADSQLVIESGVEINFCNHSRLNIYGNLKTLGNSADSVIFSYGYPYDYWRGLRFQNTSLQDSSYLSYSIITNARALDGGYQERRGGGIYCYNVNNLKIDHCRICECQADYGGGIYTSHSSLIITNSRFSNNYAYHDGGGIDFSGNSYPIIQDCILDNNTAVNDGGGIYCVSGSSMILEDIIITGNQAINYGGGGMHCWNATAILYNCDIINNSGLNGAGLAVTNNSIVALENCLISENYSIWKGGGINISQSTVTGNNLKITLNHSEHSGGGIYTYGYTLNLSNTRISNNVATDNGGGVLTYGNSEIFFSSENRCNIYDNISQNPENKGHDIYSSNSDYYYSVILDTFSVLTPTDYHAHPLENFEFDILNGKNELVSQDIYVDWQGSDDNSGLSPDDPLQSIFTALQRINPNSLNPLTIHIADGIYSPITTSEFYPLLGKSFLTLEGESKEATILDGNMASNIFSVVSKDSLSLENLTLKNGHTSDEGGAIYCSYGTDLKFFNLLIKNNSANNGGGIYTEFSQIEIIDCDIDANTATYSGGGINSDNWDTNLYLSGTNIRYNICNEYGGGLYHNVYNSLVFDPENRCNIYLNRSLINLGNDLGCYIYFSNENDIIVDTFTVAQPTDLFAYPIEDFNFDIMNAKIEYVDQDLYVSPEGSDSNSGLNPQEALKTIYFATLLIENEGDNINTIYLANGVYSPSTNGEIFPINFAKGRIRLEGENRDETIIDAEQTNNVFKIIEQDSIYINSLTVTGGSANYGSGFCIEESFVEMENLFITENYCNLLDYYSITSGGGIYCLDSDLIMTDCLLTNNHSKNGGGIFSDSSELTLTNIICQENSALNGAGIYLDNTDPDLTGCSFSYNNLIEWFNQFGTGGGIFIDENSTPDFSDTELNSIYSNFPSYNTSSGFDIFTDHYLLDTVLDTFTVSYLNGKYAYPPNRFLGFSAQNSFIEQTDANLYVNPSGSDLNDGLSPESPLRTISHALDIIFYNQEQVNSIILAPGEYSGSTNGENFPLFTGQYLIIEGEDPTTTVLSTGTDNFHFELYGVDSLIMEGITLQQGKGINCFDVNLTMNDLIIKDNTATDLSIIYAKDTDLVLENCYFYQNSKNVTGNVNGSIISMKFDSNFIMNKTTISNNISDTQNLIYLEGSCACLLNSIIWNNDPAIIKGINVSSNDYNLLFSHNDIQGGIDSLDIQGDYNLQWLEGNIDADPLFLDPESNDFSLQSTSPCIDSGIAYFAWEEQIFIDMEEDTYWGIAPDMGAFEYGMIENDENVIQFPTTTSLDQNYPNPFNPETRINFRLPKESEVKLIIYNIKGQRIKTLFKGNKQRGKHSLFWDGRDDAGKNLGSGIYFYKLSAGKQEIIKKMMLLK